MTDEKTLKGVVDGIIKKQGNEKKKTTRLALN